MLCRAHSAFALFSSEAPVQILGVVGEPGVLVVAHPTRAVDLWHQLACVQVVFAWGRHQSKARITSVSCLETSVVCLPVAQDAVGEVPRICLPSGSVEGSSCNVWAAVMQGL